MKLNMVRVTTEEVTVEVPDECLGCGANLRSWAYQAGDGDAYPLVEESWIGARQPVVVDEHGKVIDAKDGEETYEISHVVGYQCAACEYQLASTEMAAPVVAAAPVGT